MYFNNKPLPDNTPFMEDPKNPSKNPFTNFKTATCKYFALGI